MAHGLNNSVLKRGVTHCKPEGKTGIGSRRIFSPQFKLQVLDSYRNDADCKGNQRATARKYGIHRRQIQKWLQVENALRSGVKQQSGKGAGGEQAAASLNVNRQRDGGDGCRSAGPAGGVESRVPAPSETSAGWQRNQAPLDFTTRGATCDPAAPIDLSFKKPASFAGFSVSSPTSAAALVSPPRPRPPAFQPDVWDLSTKSLKRSRANDDDERTTKPPVKLFKPYLDEEEDAAAPPPPQPVYFCQQVTCSSQVYYVNNNNYDTYTLHELQPKGYYYHPYYPAGDYEGVACCAYGEEAAVPSKQRQSYSLDFKLSAIDCYYQDTMCKGNQRAVAAKYNVHRRQVQKWLKQADELKSRNEVLQQTHAVR